MSEVAGKLMLTQNEARALLDAVIDRLVEHRKYVRAQEEPSERAYEFLDTLQALMEMLKAIVYRPFHS